MLIVTICAYFHCCSCAGFICGYGATDVNPWSGIGFAMAPQHVDRLNASTGCGHTDAGECQTEVPRPANTATDSDLLQIPWERSLGRSFQVTSSLNDFGKNLICETN